MEGAGSPAEINLRDFNIEYMAVARMGHTPVIVVADINLGGCLVPRSKPRSLNPGIGGHGSINSKRIFESGDFDANGLENAQAFDCRTA
jgi:hypothetical protein